MNGLLNMQLHKQPLSIVTKSLTKLLNSLKMTLNLSDRLPSRTNYKKMLARQSMT